MARYRNALPQLSGRLFLTDGGLETCLIFHDGRDLPHFAAFDLLRSAEGRETLKRYYRPYLDIARAQNTGFVLESATWRASPDWGEKLGYSAEDLAEANRTSIELLEELRAEDRPNGRPIVISGCVGPRGDGYDPGEVMSPLEAQNYHAAQIGCFRDTAADMVTAITMTNTPEAIGVTRAAVAAGLPVAISFTLETDGNLPTGESLPRAIGAVDAATGGAPAYYMINCAHPTHFMSVLAEGGEWTNRLRGLRANASSRSHAELDQATDLDDGDPVELGRQYAQIRRRMPRISVLGGCCGTDCRHVEQISLACT
ncbi:homocysteine S-methyltransferase family protein [Stappia sp. F7233]|uniref:Homocysteine S-methyltransferase family protein n=1 Tax=Stappia albiluteola TaxID=2758565 RepID=A0A839AEY0_9HYPH|nr:homocysteine S-methyltransferase family protein [Stappia albiluteola]MBA5777129.1 homocysteine S-methyltransferase family protein [Stappia albiluteola]